MKTLIVYYSRTNITKQIAEKLQSELNCDVEEISDDKKYGGKLGYIRGGFQATTGKSSKLKDISKNPADYDLVIVGTPVWASNMATPIYTYLEKYHRDIKNIACFCTCISGGYEKTLEKMGKVSRKQPVSTMYLTSKDIENPGEKINSFINNIE